MDNNLQQGIAAAKAGDQSRAFEFLTRASQNPATAEQAWLWLSGVVGDDSERLFCLDSVLKLNPGNQAAQRGATLLRQKGVFPAVPVYPEPKRPAPELEFSSAPQASPKLPQQNFASPAPSARELESISASIPQPGHAFEANKQDRSGLIQYAAMELANKRPRQEVEKALVSQGASPKEAKAIVTNVQDAIKQSRREKHKKRMIRGLIWTVLGAIITCGTYVFANELGGNFLLCWGAILFGIIDFVIGLVGWLTSG